MAEEDHAHNIYWDEIYSANLELDPKTLAELYDAALRIIELGGLAAYKSAAESTMLDSLSASQKSRYPELVERSRKVFQDLTYRLLSTKNVNEEDLQIITLEAKRDIKKWLQDKGDYVGD